MNDAATEPEASAGGPPPAASQRLKLDRSLMARAMTREPEALELLARQFIPAEEKLLHGDFLGIQGIWGLGQKSFVFLSDRRTASLRVGPFGEVIYQDGYLEHVNSGVVVQPSRLLLFILVLFSTMLSLAFCSLAQGQYLDLKHWARYFDTLPVPLFRCLFVGVLLLLAPLSLPLFWWFSVRLFYRFQKCGLVLWIREGIAVYAFCNRGLMRRANQFYRKVSQSRDQRIADDGKRA